MLFSTLGSFYTGGSALLHKKGLKNFSLSGEEGNSLHLGRKVSFNRFILPEEKSKEYDASS